MNDIDTVYRKVKRVRRLLKLTEENELKAVRKRYKAIWKIFNVVDEKVTMLRLKA